jgi:general secretion pathway protein E
MTSIPTIPTNYARQHGALIIANEDRAEIWFKDTVNLSVYAEICRTMQQDCVAKVVGKDDFERELKLRYERQASDTIQAVDGIGEELNLFKLADELNEPADILEQADDAPIVKLLNALIAEAVREDASDIHIEQYENRLRVRFRLDGVLKEILNPDVKIAPRIISRVKIMAKLDISEKRVPQDGRISVRVGGRPVDVRVSTIPVGNGAEKVVLRLLNKESGRLSLEYLGMPSDAYAGIEKILAKPHGILLVTGPTGSGKTTTLYSVLSRLNNKDSNIMTVEDPVEYYLDGINQTQVNAKVGMTFAGALRSILRQDPDIIMIGEIRDLETAKIAVQASLTGHQVFATLHTNTAVGAVTRLRDMGVEPFLLASSLNGVLAQRLVRNLCPSCKTPYEASESEKDKLGVGASEALTLYQPSGCKECDYTGFKGRTGLFDLFYIDHEASNMIHAGASEQTLAAYKEQDSQSLFASGVELVVAGKTAISEIIREAGE